MPPLSLRPTCRHDCWSAGVFLYVAVGSLVVARLLLYPLWPADLTPPYWVARRHGYHQLLAPTSSKWLMHHAEAAHAKMKLRLAAPSCHGRAMTATPT